MEDDIRIRQAPIPACIVQFAAAWSFSMIFGAAVLCAQEPAPPVQTVPTLRATVNRVFVDVVVTDRKGKPVTGLTSEDFQVLEDGVVQPVRSFDAHVLKRDSNPPPPNPLKLPPNTFANLVLASPDAPLTVILYDVINTPLEALPYAHNALVSVIKKQQSGTRIAIFVLGDRLRMLQGFTDDETRLLNAINSKGGGTQISSLLQTDSSSSNALSDLNAEGAPGADALSGLKSLESTEATMMQQQRLEMTVDAFTLIARFVSGLPGRKSLLWLSGSFPSAVLPNSDPGASGTANEFGDAYDYSYKVKEAEDLLNLNHVAVYPVDVRGLQVTGQFSAASNAKTAPNSHPAIVANPNGNAEHTTMDQVAEDTGGRAFYNTNGLEEAMQTALDEGATYYTLTYAPSNTKQDGTQRKIVVKLRQPGYQLSYRRSYFADDLAHPSQAAQKTAAEDANHSLFLDAGMQHGAPISSQLFFETSVYPVGDPVAPTPKEMEALAQFQADTRSKKKTVEKVQHYQVDYAILGRTLDLPAIGDGTYGTDMTFALAAYTADSDIVNGVEARVKNHIPLAQYQKIKTQGYHAKLDFAVPVQATALRIAVRDGIGNRLGSIELPLPIGAPKQQAAPPPP